MEKITSTAVKLAVQIYDPIPPNVFNAIFRIGETTCGTVLLDDVFYIVCQGTENIAGWKADFDVMPTKHPILGNLHGGFYKNLDELVKQLLPTIPPNTKVVVTGHSKGAGEGSILAALLHLKGIDIESLALFACPNSGDERFSLWLSKNIKGISYRNTLIYASFLGDPVPLDPPSPYVRPYPHTVITAPPSGLSKLVNLEWHKGSLYEQGVQAIK